ncbi:putative endoribonuclease [Pedobacter sp. BAL39]|nr:putative endoribonuclease [Pedobacter sp. BAL39]
MKIVRFFTLKILLQPATLLSTINSNSMRPERTAKVAADESLVSKKNNMEKRIINPWQWQDQRSYVQAVEVRQVESTLYCAGQAAVEADGTSSTGNMKTQLQLAIQNLEQVITEAGYECKNIVRLNILTTSSTELFTCFDLLQEWVARHGIQQASTVCEVTGLFETLKVELEATAVR